MFYHENPLRLAITSEFSPYIVGMKLYFLPFILIVGELLIIASYVNFISQGQDSNLDELDDSKCTLETRRFIDCYF